MDYNCTACIYTRNQACRVVVQMTRFYPGYPVILSNIFYSHSHMTLSQQNHLLRLLKMPCLDPVQIDTGSQPAAIKRIGMVTGFQSIVNQSSHLFAKDVVDLQRYKFGIGNLEFDGG
jgi:hypothetical protein